MQWVENKGQCGVCGDAYHLKEPRPHEAGGEYAKGTIVKHYTVGQVILSLSMPRIFYYNEARSIDDGVEYIVQIYRISTSRSSLQPTI